MLPSNLNLQQRNAEFIELNKKLLQQTKRTQEQLFLIKINTNVLSHTILQRELDSQEDAAFLDYNQYPECVLAQ